MVQTVPSGGAAGAVPAVLDVPVIMQRREQWKFRRFSSSPGLVDIPVRNRDRLLSAVGCDEWFFRPF